MDTKPISSLISEAKESLSSEDFIDWVEEVRDLLHEESLLKDQPVDRVRWVDVNEVQANDYNPNSVASQEMSLLYTSILHDGYTQPVVTIWDELEGKYVIVDGFHRYFTCKTNQDIKDRNAGRLPIVVLQKDVNERMAATVRHNRARGKHSVGGMSSMVFNMLDNGWSDAEICQHLGMEPDELLRLKHITGFSKLFADADYSKAWTTKHQIMLKKKQREHSDKAR
jgi:ParB-like chromosome segregation protein Spo0J